MGDEHWFQTTIVALPAIWKGVIKQAEASWKNAKALFSFKRLHCSRNYEASSLQQVGCSGWSSGGLHLHIVFFCAGVSPFFFSLALRASTQHVAGEEVRDPFNAQFSPHLLV